MKEHYRGTGDFVGGEYEDEVALPVDRELDLMFLQLETRVDLRIPRPLTFRQAVGQRLHRLIPKGRDIIERIFDI